LRAVQSSSTKKFSTDIKLPVLKKALPKLKSKTLSRFSFVLKKTPKQSTQVTNKTNGINVNLKKTPNIPIQVPRTPKKPILKPVDVVKKLPLTIPEAPKLPASLPGTPEKKKVSTPPSDKQTAETRAKSNVIKTSPNFTRDRYPKKEIVILKPTPPRLPQTPNTQEEKEQQQQQSDKVENKAIKDQSPIVVETVDAKMKEEEEQRKLKEEKDRKEREERMKIEQEEKIKKINS